MKIQRAGAAGPARKIGTVGYTARGEAVAAPASVPAVSVVASVLGIPEEEFTPRVRDAIMQLMGEVDTLRRDLNDARVRLLEAEKTADSDHLLPVLNRRAFVRELTRYIAFAARYNTPASLIYFDLDGFKDVNDTHGHAAGDAVLGHFADVLLSQVRESDVVGRLGGDEFGVILSHATSQQAARKATSLAELLRSRPALWRGQPIPVGFSFGAFELMPGENADTAMARADEAMYMQKRGNAR